MCIVQVDRNSNKENVVEWDICETEFTELAVKPDGLYMMVIDEHRPSEVGQ